MSANDDAGSKRNDAFVYHGQEGGDVPRDVTRVRVHPSVRVIRARAFLWRSRLISVELHDGLEVIEEGGILRMQVTSRNLVPPLRQGDQAWGIL